MNPTVSLYRILLLAIPLYLSVTSITFAQESSFSTIVKASNEDSLADLACAQAFNQAREEALLQFDESAAADDPQEQLELIDQQQTRRKSGHSKTICEVTTSWQSNRTNDLSSLIGTEQSISGAYTGQCLDEARRATCWNRITDQAKRDLMTKLSENYTNIVNVRAIYIDFEGRQRDQYQDGRYTSTADGEFYFDIVAANNVSSIQVQRKDAKPAVKPPPEPAADIAKPKKDSGPDFDVSLSYTWDGNDSATFNSTAISSGRLGVGIWADNRLGFVAFSGEDTLGIGTSNSRVKNSSASYSTTGVGMGVRLWKNRDFTLENHVYYVDAKPFEADIINLCSDCTDRTFRSEDYLQTTMNFKTNSKGVNIGWMLTWKWLDNTVNVDKLSGGWFVEVLF
ncbi:hypothetical protein [Reinekea sp.]|jgi:hypothetical protein|uniref:hypothetical protein n=1 Tax=Reinekea sp. TaxID=1970455 RepID=UPI0039895F1A